MENDNWYYFENYGVGQFKGIEILSDGCFYVVSFPFVPVKIFLPASKVPIFRKLSSKEDLKEMIYVLPASKKVKVKKQTWRQFSVNFEKNIKSISLPTIISLIIDCSSRIPRTQNLDGLLFYQSKAINLVAQEYSIVFNVSLNEAIQIIENELHRFIPKVRKSTSKKKNFCFKKA